MIFLDEVMQLHDKSIKDYGGSYGIRDTNLLESAIARPYQSFGDVEFYPTPLKKRQQLLRASSRIICLLMGIKEPVFLQAILCCIEVELKYLPVRKKYINLLIMLPPHIFLLKTLFSSFNNTHKLSNV